MFNKIDIKLPQNINLTVLKKKKNKNILNITIKNDIKIFTFYIRENESSFKFDKNTNTIIINKNWLNVSNNKFSKFLLDFLKSWDFFFFEKIKFKGKGFRIRFLKKNKLVKFFFGRSHKTFIFFKKIFLKKINKYKFILKNINKNRLHLNSHLINKIKPLNFYTLRGLRKSKQIIFKRKGKKGTYI